MKKKLKFGLLILSTFVLINANAQSPYKLEVEQEVIGTDLHMSIYATKISGADFGFSSCNFAVVIDTANLDLQNMSKVNEGIWDNDTDPQSYLDMYLGKGPNFLNLSTKRNTSGSGLGQILPSTKTLVAEVLIPIRNQCTTNTSTWVSIPAAQNKFPLDNIKSDATFINPAPDFPLCISPDEPNLIYAGFDTICEGSAAQLNTSATGSVQWYLDGTELVGETGQTLDATQSGTYTVEALNCICKTMSTQSQTLYINPLPTTPVITQNGSSLQIEPTTSEIYWYRDGNLIASNTTVIDNIEDGRYTVMLKNDCGDKMSEAVEITTSGITSSLSTGITASPNPFKGTSNITMTLANAAEVSLIVYNVLGEEVTNLMSGKKPAGEYNVKFDIEGRRMSDGVYMVKLMIDDKEQQVLKLVEIK